MSNDLDTAVIALKLSKLAVPCPSNVPVETLISVILPRPIVVPSSVILEFPIAVAPVNLTTVLVVPPTATEVPDVPLVPEEPAGAPAN
jgi:hypothetical protein